MRGLLALNQRTAALIRICLFAAACLPAAGCQPERPVKPLSPAHQSSTAESGTAESGTAESSTAESSTAAAVGDGAATAVMRAPRGKIETTEDGYVSLGVGPAAGQLPSEPAAFELSAGSPTGDQPAKPATTAKPATAAKPTTTASLATATTKVEKNSQGAINLDEKNQQIAPDWPQPEAVLFITGQQHGYIEPCGCTGLENQKGGLNRRDTLLTQLRERGWNVVPMDVGNFERRTGIQAEIKLQSTAKALKAMDYRAVTFGVDDLKLSSQELLALSASDETVQTPFISANTYILVEEYMPKFRIIEAGKRKIGVTAVLGDSFTDQLQGSTDIVVAPAVESLRQVMDQLKSQKCDYIVLLSHAKLAESRAYASQVPGFDLIVSAGDYPEPDFQLEAVEGTTTKLLQVGAKGMFTSLVALYPDTREPVRYQRVALSAQFADSPRMMKLFQEYQQQLQDRGLDGLRVPTQALEDNLKFVGSQVCGDCHTKAFEVWKSSEHFTATESLVHPPNSRSMIPRHFDPECLSCHVTGWNPQRYYPYSSGFESLEKTPLLTGNGCENCHGAGSAHVAAESGDAGVDEATLVTLREKMRLPLSEAKERCQQCHDQDNSPEFQHDGAFEEYWEQIKHEGKD